jgi:hypothetical protein
MKDVSIVRERTPGRAWQNNHCLVRASPTQRIQCFHESSLLRNWHQRRMAESVLKQRWLVWKSLQSVARIFATMLFDLKVYGLDHVPAIGGALIVAAIDRTFLAMLSQLRGR